VKPLATLQIITKVIKGYLEVVSTKNRSLVLVLVPIPVY
jgi:hypothetical protein